MAHDVFLSHSAKNKAVADAMCAVLESSGIRCWVAPRDVPPGATWAEAITAGIRESRAFVLIFSSEANASAQVLREVDQAVKAAVPVFPFRLDDTAPSRAFDYYISTSHWLDALTPPLEAHLHRLRDTLKATLGTSGRPAPAPAVPQPLPPQPPARPTRPWLVPAALFATLLVAGGAYALFQAGGRAPRTGSAKQPIPAAQGVWRTFLEGWAEAAGSEVDAATGYPKRIRRTKDGGEMVLIPAGTFQMGLVPDTWPGHSDEEPRHAVTLTRAYYLDVYEVTVGQWKRYLASGGGRLPNLRGEATDAHPIHNLDWTEASAYASWAGAALPTEAQWERAAKGGHDEFVFPWGRADDEKRRNGPGSEDGYDGLAPVGSFEANDYQLHDMGGNVFEFCADWYDREYYQVSPLEDPSGPALGRARVVRGGSWAYDISDMRAANRTAAGPGPLYRYDHTGFRLAKSL